jgi:hypothetical protein
MLRGSLIARPLRVARQNGTNLNRNLRHRFGSAAMSGTTPQRYRIRHIEKNSYMRFIFLLAGLLCLAACQNPTQPNHTLELPEQAFTFEGPLFEGPNTANATLNKAELTNLAQKASFDLSKAQSVTLESVVVDVDSTTGALFSNFALQAVAGKRDLISVAIAQGGNSGNIALSPSKEANVTPYFTGHEDLTWVLDANAAHDDTSTYQVKLKVRLNVAAPAVQ